METPARPARRLKLLLDVHHSRLAAERLRERGHDVVAAADDPILASLPDEDLLVAATGARRAVVTENARDFDRIVRAWSGAGKHHLGVVFTSPRRYVRASRAYPEDLVAALDAFLAAPPADQTDLVHWLA